MGVRHAGEWEAWAKEMDELSSAAERLAVGASVTEEERTRTMGRLKAKTWLRRIPRRNSWEYKEVHWPEEWEWRRCGLGGWLATGGRTKSNYSAPVTWRGTS